MEGISGDYGTGIVKSGAVPDAGLYVIPGGGNVFRGGSFDLAASHMAAYLSAGNTNFGVKDAMGLIMWG